MNLVSRVGIAALTLVVGVRPTAAGTDPWGYGELKIGMTMEEADALRTDDRVEKCDYAKMTTCLVRDEEVFGYPAQIIAQMSDDTKRVAGILVKFMDFGRKQQRPCSMVADDVSHRMTKSFGKPKCDRTRINCSWKAEGGGNVGLYRFCTSDPAAGFVSIRFSQDSE